MAIHAGVVVDVAVVVEPVLVVAVAVVVLDVHAVQTVLVPAVAHVLVVVKLLVQIVVKIPVHLLARTSSDTVAVAGLGYPKCLEVLRCRIRTVAILLHK